VLLGVIALVAFVRPADPDGLWRQARSDRYVSVRHVAALQTFERAVVHRGSTAPSLVTPRAVLDGLPACRREWGGDTGALHALRELVVGHGDDAPLALRIAAQLNELDAALLRFSVRPNRARRAPCRRRRRALVRCRRRRPGDAARDPPRRPGSASRCAAPTWRARSAPLRRADAAMLETFAWRGSEGAATLARWRPDQEMRISAREVTRRIPGAGSPAASTSAAPATANRPAISSPPRAASSNASAPRAAVSGATPEASGSAAALGGVALVASRAVAASLPSLALSPASSASALALAAAALTGPFSPPIALQGEPGPGDAIDDPRWQVPPSLLTLLQPLESLRQPTGALYRVYATATTANRSRRERPAPSRAIRVVLDGAPVDLGYSIDVTIDPALQALAQKTAACYTGPPRRLSSAGDAPRRGRRAAARIATARRCDGADGGGSP
jgi:hypothetical protein